MCGEVIFGGLFSVSQTQPVCVDFGLRFILFCLLILSKCIPTSGILNAYDIIFNYYYYFWYLVDENENERFTIKQIK